MNRQVIIGGTVPPESQDALRDEPHKVELVVVRDDAPGQPVTLERLIDFVEDVRIMRALQALYVAKLDPVVRREAESMEVVVDSRIGWLAADLAATQATAAKGGAK